LQRGIKTDASKYVTLSGATNTLSSKQLKQAANIQRDITRLKEKLAWLLGVPCG